MSVQRRNSEEPLLSSENQLRVQSNQLKQTALTESNVVCEKINDHILSLEIDYKSSQSSFSSFIGKIFKPITDRNDIKTSKLLLKQIIVLKKAMAKTDDVAQIDKISRDILNKIKLFELIKKTDDNESPDQLTSAVKLANKIIEVEKTYQKELPKVLNSMKKRIDIIEKLAKPVLTDSAAHKNTITAKKIQNLKTHYDKNKDITPSSFQSLAKLERDLTQMESIQNIERASEEIIDMVYNKGIALEDMMRLSDLPPTSKTYFQNEALKITSTLEKKFMENFSPTEKKLSLEMIKELSNLDIALRNLQEEYNTTQHEHKNARKIYVELENCVYKEIITYVGSSEEIPATAEFSQEIARTHLKNISNDLEKRLIDIKKNYEKEMNNAKTPYDFKKIADNCQKLFEDILKARDIGIKTQLAIEDHSRAWKSLTSEGGNLDVSSGSELDKATKQKFITRYVEKAAFLKGLAKDDLKAYIFNLQEMTKRIRDNK